MAGQMTKPGDSQLLQQQQGRDLSQSQVTPGNQNLNIEELSAKFGGAKMARAFTAIESVAETCSGNDMNSWNSGKMHSVAICREIISVNNSVSNWISLKDCQL